MQSAGARRCLGNPQQTLFRCECESRLAVLCGSRACAGRSAVSAGAVAVTPSRVPEHTCLCMPGTYAYSPPAYAARAASCASCGPGTGAVACGSRASAVRGGGRCMAGMQEKWRDCSDRPIARRPASTSCIPADPLVQGICDAAVLVMLGSGSLAGQLPQAASPQPSCSDDSRYMHWLGLCGVARRPASTSCIPAAPLFRGLAT